MKRTLAILLALVMVLAMFACKSGNKQEAVSQELAGTYDILVWTGEAAVDLTKQQIENFNNTNAYGIKFNATVNPAGPVCSPRTGRRAEQARHRIRCGCESCE